MSDWRPSLPMCGGSPVPRSTFDRSRVVGLSPIRSIRQAGCKVAISKRRRKTLKRAEAYLRVLQPLMGLAHWTIEIALDPPENNAWGDVTRLSHAQDAAIRLCEDFGDLTSEQRRETMVHELLHCHLRDLIGTPAMVKQEISLPLWAALGDRMNHAEECIVDALARIIAPFLPLPEAKE